MAVSENPIIQSKVKLSSHVKAHLMFCRSEKVSRNSLNPQWVEWAMQGHQAEYNPTSPGY